MTADELGRQGEAAAENYLQKLGMRTLARRYRRADGELDLVMEVKLSGKGGRGSGLCRVTPSKQRRMIHAAASFLLEREWTERPARFDVVEITTSGLYHVPCAFEASAW